MTNYRVIFWAAVIVVLLDVLAITGFYLYSFDLANSYSITSSSEIVSRINTENDIEALRDIAYRKHIQANHAENSQIDMQRGISSLLLFNGLLLVYFNWFIWRKMNSNKALQSDAAEPRR